MKPGWLMKLKPPTEIFVFGKTTPAATSIDAKSRGTSLPGAPFANASGKYEKPNRPGVLPLPSFQSPDHCCPASIFTLLGLDAPKYTSSEQLLIIVTF
jgi:hypothetical protein